MILKKVPPQDVEKYQQPLTSITESWTDDCADDETNSPQRSRETMAQVGPPLSLHTQIQKVQVAIRVRPLNKPELLESKKRSRSFQSVPARVSRAVAKRCEQLHSINAWTLLHEKPMKATSSISNHHENDTVDVLVEKGVIRKNEGNNVFPFDWVFDENTSTRRLYQTVIRPMIKTVFAGRHGTIFTYGQTGSGKTYTMQGSNSQSRDRSEGKHLTNNDGIIHMSVRDLFQSIAVNSDIRDYTVHVCFFEIYNEQVRDLLGNVDDKSNKKSSRNHHDGNQNKLNLPVLTVREYVNGSDVHVDAVQRPVKNVADVLEILQEGNKHRTCAPTALNEMSSRSHAILRLTIESREHPQEQKGDPVLVDASNTTGESKDGMMRVSVLNFVDLAGSESSHRSSTAGRRKQEGGKINQSLLSLSQVIQTLSLPQNQRPKFINYRNSKLTRILRPHLSGNAVMTIFCCITLARIHLEETRSTLKFAYNAKQIEINPVINEVTDDRSLIVKLQKELEDARRTLRNLKEKSRTEAYDRQQQSNLDITSISTFDTSYLLCESKGGDNQQLEQKQNMRHQMTKPHWPDTIHMDACSQGENSSSHAAVVPMKRFVERGSEEEGNAESVDFTTISDDAPNRYAKLSEEPPSEVVIFKPPSSQDWTDGDINVRLKEAEQRETFLREKLEATNSLVEHLSRELTNARICIHDLVFRNARLEKQLKAFRDAKSRDTRREDRHCT